MANAILRFTFSGPGRLDGDKVGFSIRNKVDLSVVDYFEAWQLTPRSGPNQIQNYTSDTFGTKSAQDFGKYLKLDYGISGLIKRITSGSIPLNVVEIEAVNSNYEFINVINDGNVTYTIQDSDEPVNDFDYVGSVVFSESTDPNNYVKLTTQTTNLIKTISKNGVLITDDNSIQPYEFDVLRDSSTYFQYKDANENELWYPQSSISNTNYGKKLWIPKLAPDKFNVNTVNSVSGATITVENDLPTSGLILTTKEIIDLDLLYSLDGVTWQTRASFSAQADGAGTMYVKDQFGAQISFPYEVRSASSREPFVFISKANSVSFTEYEEWDDCSIFKNTENTLEHQSLNRINYCIPILFNTCQRTKIQIKSNFENIDVTLRKEIGPDEPIILTQKTQNLDLFESMDCTYYKYNDSYTGVYFTTGNTYDENGAITGTYGLNGNLPDFAIIGVTIKVGILGSFKISDTLFDNNVGKKVILIKNSYSGVEQSAIASSIYDVLPYNVYEFEIVWSNFGEGTFDLVIDNHNSIETIGSPTNAVLHSEKPSLLPWQSGTMDRLDNVEPFPGGLYQGSKLIGKLNQQNGFFMGQAITKYGDSNNFKISLYAKADELVRLRFGGQSIDFSSGAQAYVRLDNGTIYNTIENGAWKVNSTIIEDVTGGWYKCTINLTTDGASQFYFMITLLDNVGNTNFVGDGVSGLFVRGMQAQDDSTNETEYVEATTNPIIGTSSGITILDQAIFLSENIQIKDKHEEVLNIIYFNENNRDIFYKWGQENEITVPYIDINPNLVDEIENTSGDLISSVVSSSVKILDEFVFGDLSYSIMIKLCIALSCENVFINGLGYIKNGSFEIERIPNTNVYEVKAVMLRSNLNYNNNKQGQTGFDEGYLPFNIPALLKAGNGFIRT